MHDEMHGKMVGEMHAKVYGKMHGEMQSTIHGEMHGEMQAIKKFLHLDSIDLSQLATGPE